jgi:quercetin dioxygenase-like cupin family protein
MRILLIESWRFRISLKTVTIVAALLCSSGVPAQTVQRGAGTIATTVLGVLPPVPLYWHLDNFPDRATAEAAMGARSAVAESFGKVWLFTIAEFGWRPINGTRVARAGPLPLAAGGTFTATYLDAETAPGFQTDVHQHGGPEALYTISGEVCLETPQGKMIGREGGDPLVIAGDQPMRLTSIGTEKRRSIVLVLHDSSQPWKVPATGWTPKGLCSNG